MWKRLAVITAVALLISGIFIAKADSLSHQEMEKNDERKNANVLFVNEDMKGVTGYRDGARDIDMYRISVDHSGSLQISFDHDYIDTSSACYRLRVFTENEDALLWEASVPGNRIKSEFYEFYVAEGTIYLAVVPERQESTVYTLRADYARDEYCEKELNNTFASADETMVNQWYKGALAVEDDVDIYRLKLSEPGAVSFQFRHEYFDDTSTYYNFDIRKNESPDSTCRKRDFTGRDDDWESNTFYLPAGEYYICLSDYYHTAIPYEFCLNHAPLENTELEFNDTFKNATSISANLPAFGAHALDDDEDYYSFEITESGVVQINFRHEYFDDGSTYYRLEFYDAPRHDGLLFQKDITGKNSDYSGWEFYLDQGTYYLKVGSYSWTTVPYEFTLTHSPMANVELERNNSYKTATTVETNMEYNGSIISDEDIDYYRFTLPAPSEITLSFIFEYIDDGSDYFSLALDMTDNNSKRYFSAQLAGRDSSYATNTFFLDAGTYYLSIDDYYFTARPYALAIWATDHPSCETEWNNTYKDADIITLNNPVSGALRYREDKDIYQFELQSKKSVSIRLEHEWIDSNDVYFQVHLDSQPNNNGRLASMKARAKDTVTVIDNELTLYPGIYYLVVEEYSYSSKPYSITVNTR